MRPIVCSICRSQGAGLYISLYLSANPSHGHVLRQTVLDSRAFTINHSFILVIPILCHITFVSIFFCPYAYVFYLGSEFNL